MHKIIETRLERSELVRETEQPECPCCVLNRSIKGLGLMNSCKIWIFLGLTLTHAFNAGQKHAPLEAGSRIDSGKSLQVKVIIRVCTYIAYPS